MIFVCSSCGSTNVTITVDPNSLPVHSKQIVEIEDTYCHNCDCEGCGISVYPRNKEEAKEQQFNDNEDEYKYGKDSSS